MDKRHLYKTAYDIKAKEYVKIVGYDDRGFYCVIYQDGVKTLVREEELEQFCL